MYIYLQNNFRPHHGATVLKRQREALCLCSYRHVIYAKLSYMRRTVMYLSIFVLLMGCGAVSPMKYRPGMTYTGATYRLIILSYSGQRGALGAAVLDLEGDDITYEPHPEEKHVQTFKGMSFAEASEKARGILGRHCGVFTYSSILLADKDNIHTGYEIKPAIKETAYCILGKPLSVNYMGPENGVIVISLPVREALPYTPEVQIFR